MGIRRKIFLGFVIISFILFLSGWICIFQLMKIEKTVSGMLTDNIKSMDIAELLLDESESQTWNIFHRMTNSESGNKSEIVFNGAELERLIHLASQNITANDEEIIIENLRLNYENFKASALTLDSILTTQGNIDGNICFNTMYKPSFKAFNSSIRELRTVNQNAISHNSHKLESSFYRMTMPLIIAIVVGLCLIILFNYFINMYFITPILNIIKGIKNYFEQKTPYDVKIETKDEINELNREIKVLIAHSKKKESASPGVFQFNKNTSVDE